MFLKRAALRGDKDASPTTVDAAKEKAEAEAKAREAQFADDVLSGGSVGDRLTGGAGKDTLSGGAGGTLTGSALNTRLPLSSARGLTLTVSTSSSATATRNVTANIRRIGESAILGTRTFPLTAEANRV